MPFQRRLGGITGFQRRNFFSRFKFTRLQLARSAGKLAEIVLPRGILGEFLVVDLFFNGVPALGLGGLIRRRLVTREFLKKRIVQHLLLHGFQQFHARELKQLDGLL